MTNDEILSIFFLECEEALGAAEGGLDACRDGNPDDDTVNAVFRAVHSIKGGAGAFGFVQLQAFTHGFETLLSDVRDGSVPVTDALVSLLLRALDTLSDHVGAARSGSQPPEDAALLAELAAALAGNAPAAGHEAEAAPAEQAVDEGLAFDLDALMGDMTESTLDNSAEVEDDWLVRVRPLPAAMDNGCEPILLLRELEALGGTCLSCDATAVPTLEALDCGQTYLVWTFAMPASVSQAEVADLFDFVGDDCEVTYGAEQAVAVPQDAPVAGPDVKVEENIASVPEPVAKTAMPEPAAVAPPAAAAAAGAAAAPSAPVAPSQAANAGQSIRIDLTKLDRLIDSVGELVIAQAMMAQRLSGHGLAGIEEMAMLDTLTRDIQESAMAIRAQPIGSVFSRVPRMLRELEGSTGKRVNLEVSGEATELDKTVIERLGEPLTHLIRNAVDHGIETPEERRAAGKQEQGTLLLSAEQRSGRMLIKIADDGKGIDRERVFAKAVERGLVSADAALSNEEIDNLIFAPGFSTAATVSNISGRGVGMDVVRQNVKDLGGRITIDSVPGSGTTFTLALPLTLAISDGMIVTVGDQALVVPLAHVVESLRPDEHAVQSLGPGRHMLDVRGKFIPVLPLERSVGAAGAVTDPTKGVLVVVDTEAAGQAALLVDTIDDQRQFVIKSLDSHYRMVDGVAGATILGDGRVALILDVDGIVANSISGAPERQAA